MKKDIQNENLDLRYLDYAGREDINKCKRLVYTLSHEHSPLQVFHIEEFNKIEVAINIPYFLQGHNYSISFKKEQDVIEYISIVTGINMFHADAHKFEYCSLFEVPHPFQRIKASHLKIPGMKTDYFDNGKYFRDRTVTHRLYDAQKNIKDKLSSERRSELKATSDYDENKHYIKVENKYRKPEVALKKRGILVEDLFTEQFINHCKTDLMAKYKSIIKMSGVQVIDKKQLSSDTLYLIALKRLEGITGINAEEHIRDTIKGYSHVLTKDDQKARVKQLKKNSEKIKPDNCPFDLTDLLNNSLYGGN